MIAVFGIRVYPDKPGGLACWIRVIVKRILRKYGYPPDKQETATQTVLEQAEVLSEIGR